jgi:hypothetical protein
MSKRKRPDDDDDDDRAAKRQKAAGSDVFNIEKLLDRRKRRKASSVSEYEYLVKWAGFGEEHNSWEPEVCLPIPFARATLTVLLCSRSLLGRKTL